MRDYRNSYHDTAYFAVGKRRVGHVQTVGYENSVALMCPFPLYITYPVASISALLIAGG